ncbi:MAG: hypothetical protein ACTHW3_07360 [Leucobacter sp.]
MKKTLGAIGFIVTLMGVSGTIDHLWRQPLMGWVLNFFNREIFTKVDWISNYALFANLIIVVLGIVILIIAERISTEE